MIMYKHTNNVSFRKADIKDAGNLLILKNDSHYSRHTITFANLSTQEKWIESISQETHCPRNLVLIASNETNMEFGIFKLFNIDWQSRSAEAGWDIFEQFRGKHQGKKLVEAGVAFAFNIMNLRRLDAQILITNERSLKCAQSAGFNIEGCQKKAIFKNYQYIDNLMLGIIKEEKNETII